MSRQGSRQWLFDRRPARRSDAARCRRAHSNHSDIHVLGRRLRCGIETLRIYQRDAVLEQLESAGSKLVAGICDAARLHGHDDLVLCGPPTMPTLLFEGDSGEKRARIFAREAAARGAIFHPRLNWFLCQAHGPNEIDRSLAIAEQALAVTPHG